MQSDPELAKKIYSLYPGPEYDRNEEISEFTINISRVNEIQKFNSLKINSHFDCLAFKQTLTGLTGLKRESGLWYNFTRILFLLNRFKILLIEGIYPLFLVTDWKCNKNISW